MRVGYSRISSEQQQAVSDPLGVAERELSKAGAEVVMVEVGSGRDDTARPKFRKLRELILDNKVTEVICPSQDRLGRNTELVLQFVELCRMQKVRLVDLNGRDLAVKTADGVLLTTITAALDQHRSDLYSEKVKRARRVAREQGLPARSTIPFGLCKIRNDAGRFIDVGIDPVTGPVARQRIDWFLNENLNATALWRRIRDEQPDWPMSRKHLPYWLLNPMLTGRYVWNRERRRKTVMGHIQGVSQSDKSRFPALITDQEHQVIKDRLQAVNTATNSGVRGRQRRMLTGLVRCSKCGVCLTYKKGGTSQLYLRCSTPECDHSSKAIHADRVVQVLQYALAMHAKALVPLLRKPASTPPEVFKLQAEIEMLQQIAGTEAVIDAKRVEIARLQGEDTSTPAWLLIGMLRSPTFWLQDEEVLNHQLSAVLDAVTVDLTQSVKTARVAAVRCKTTPPEAPLPTDQKNILIPMTAKDVTVTILEAEKIDNLMSSFSGANN